MAAIAAAALAAAFVVYLRDGADRFFAILWSDIDLFGGILVNVLAGCLIGAFATALLSREVVTRWVGAGSGVTGIMLATLAGFVFPGGPYTVYPVAGAFLAAGADAGAAVAFVVSWTLLGYTRALIWELPFLGLDFVLWRTLVAIPLPILAGLAARLVARALRMGGDEAR